MLLYYSETTSIITTLAHYIYHLSVYICSVFFQRGGRQESFCQTCRWSLVSRVVSVVALWLSVSQPCSTSEWPARRANVTWRTKLVLYQPKHRHITSTHGNHHVCNWWNWLADSSCVHVDVTILQGGCEPGNNLTLGGYGLGNLMWHPLDTMFVGLSRYVCGKKCSKICCADYVARFFLDAMTGWVMGWCQVVFCLH